LSQDALSSLNTEEIENVDVTELSKAYVRVRYEDLDKKYMDIVNLKQDYTNIEQQNESIIGEQFEEIDSKWINRIKEL
jgi:hypothetical protein